MKKQIMYCEFCGKYFCSEYGEDGYIDHYENFSRPDKHQYMSRNVETALKNIIFDGNDLRYIENIKSRLNCFLEWNDIDEKIKNETKEYCEIAIKNIEKSQNKADKVVSEMTELEKIQIYKILKGKFLFPKSEELFEKRN